MRQEAAGWRETPVLRAACTLTRSGSLGGAGAGQVHAAPARANAGIIPIGGDVCADFETELAVFNGETNHVHLLVNFPPKVTLSRLVNSLKGVSSRRMRQEFPGLARHYWRANRLWSGSYFAGSAGGAPISVLRQYIEQQNRPA